MSAYANENELIFIPCAGPGYIDTRIRPWNEGNTRNREKGQYYKKMFLKAVNTNPDFLGITSFNEWHEGTQIEPALPKTIPSYIYEDYGADTDPLYYIKKTRELILFFTSKQRNTKHIFDEFPAIPAIMSLTFWMDTPGFGFVSVAGLVIGVIGIDRIIRAYIHANGVNRNQ